MTIYNFSITILERTLLGSSALALGKCTGPLCWQHKMGIFHYRIKFNTLTNWTNIRSFWNDWYFCSYHMKFVNVGFCLFYFLMKGKSWNLLIGFFILFFSFLYLMWYYYSNYNCFILISIIGVFTLMFGLYCDKVHKRKLFIPNFSLYAI